MRYKLIIFFVCMVLPYYINAQKYKLSFEQSGILSVYNFSSDFPYSLPGRDLKPRLGFESELRFNYTPKEKLSYYIGVGFTKYNYTSGRFQTRFSDQILPKDGFDPPPEENLPTAIKLNQSYNYFSIPIGVQYSPNKKLVFGAGIKVLKKLSIYSYSKYYYQDKWKPESNYDKKVFDNEGYSDWNVNANTEVGYTTRILKYDITWKAAFEYALTDYINNRYGALNLYPYTFSFGASFPIYSYTK